MFNQRMGEVMVILRRLLFFTLFAPFLLYPVSMYAAAVIEQKTIGMLIVTHGMKGGGFDWIRDHANQYNNSRYVKELKAAAKAKGLEYKYIQWVDDNDPGGHFAGLPVHQRIEGGVVLAKAILDARKKYPQGSIIVLAHSLGGEVAACACELTDPKNKDLGSQTSLREKIYGAILVVGTTVFDTGLDLVGYNNIKNIILRGWNFSEQVAEKLGRDIDIRVFHNQELETLGKYIYGYVSQNYIAETSAAWEKAFAEIQNYKQQLYGAGRIHEGLVDLLITVGTPNSTGVFNYNPKIARKLFNYYSHGDCVAPLIGTRKASQGSSITIADISVHFEVADNKYIAIPDKSFHDPDKADLAPGHGAMLGDERMGRWLLRFPEYSGFKADEILGKKTRISYQLDNNTPPLILGEKQHKCCC